MQGRQSRFIMLVGNDRGRIARSLDAFSAGTGNSGASVLYRSKHFAAFCSQKEVLSLLGIAAGGSS
jgi:hypothetical protein